MVFCTRTGLGGRMPYLIRRIKLRTLANDAKDARGTKTEGLVLNFRGVVTACWFRFCLQSLCSELEQRGTGHKDLQADLNCGRSTYEALHSTLLMM